MELFWKAAASVLIALILGLALDRQGKEFAIVLTTVLCCGLGIGFFTILEPVTEFLYQLQAVTQLEGDLLKTLLKLVGIGLVGEVTAVICADAGFGSLGKGLQTLTNGTILYLSIPVFQGLLDLIREILGGV